MSKLFSISIEFVTAMHHPRLTDKKMPITASPSWCLAASSNDWYLVLMWTRWSWNCFVLLHVYSSSKFRLVFAYLPGVPKTTNSMFRAIMRCWAPVEMSLNKPIRVGHKSLYSESWKMFWGKLLWEGWGWVKHEAIHLTHSTLIDHWEQFELSPPDWPFHRRLAGCSWSKTGSLAGVRQISPRMSLCSQAIAYSLGHWGNVLTNYQGLK